MKIFVFWLKFHWSMFLRVQLTITQHWFIWWLGAEQATSHYLNQCCPGSLTHICGTKGRWVNTRMRLNTFKFLTQLARCVNHTTQMRTRRFQIGFVNMKSRLFLQKTNMRRTISLSLSRRPSVYLSLSVSLSIASLCLCTCLSASLFVPFSLSLYAAASLSLCRSVSLCLCLCLYFCRCPSVSLCISVCPSLFFLCFVVYRSLSTKLLQWAGHILLKLYWLHTLTHLRSHSNTLTLTVSLSRSFTSERA